MLRSALPFSKPAAEVEVEREEGRQRCSMHWQTILGAMHMREACPQASQANYYALKD